MKKSTLFSIAILIGLIVFIVSSPRLRSLVGLSSSETITIQRGSGTEESAASADGAGSSENAGNSSPVEETYELITLLPKDGIPSIDNPQFVTGAEADEQYSPDELVLGVEIDGDARAYSIPFLSGHEIVNDEIAGEPIAVTW